MFRHNGYSGTGLKRIAAEAQAPFGSICHFFPGGKQQRAEETIRTSGAAYGRMVPALLDSVPDPAESVAHAFEAATDDLAATDFAEWVSAGEQWFGRWVSDQNTARSLAYPVIMIVEGAFVLSPPAAIRSRCGWPAARWPS
ncbi:hypothetical protein AB0I77_26390 [Streptomyces sp. NPDC050619]|uniref:hypothetical protein n=1 Tax=Streptomyces sp. NPDC050619 TaxID=3157214 RepID=UPI003427076D